MMSQISISETHSFGPIAKFQSNYFSFSDSNYTEENICELIFINWSCFLFMTYYSLSIIYENFTSVQMKETSTNEDFSNRTKCLFIQTNTTNHQLGDIKTYWNHKKNHKIKFHWNEKNSNKPLPAKKK